MTPHDDWLTVADFAAELAISEKVAYIGERGISEVLSRGRFGVVG